LMKKQHRDFYAAFFPYADGGRAKVRTWDPRRVKTSR
jgi:hypothetical protein